MRSPIPILVHDQARLLDINQTFATLLGYDCRRSPAGTSTR
ncbi:PAS domain-containing protein [Rhodococcus sp. NPDC057014]